MFKRIVTWLGAGLLGLIVSGFVATLLAARSAPPRSELGVKDGRLAPCPDTPNCVSTQADPSDTLHYIAPIELLNSAADAQATMLVVLGKMPRMELISVEPTYIHALFRSPTMGFPDDVEIYFDEAAGQIHFRSAARMGRGDMNKNRERMEQIRAMFVNQR